MFWKVILNCSVISLTHPYLQSTIF